MKLIICVILLSLTVACTSDVLWSVSDRCNNDGCRVAVGKFFGDIAYTRVYCGNTAENTCYKK